MKQGRIDFLRQLKAYGLEHDIPNISWETAEWLHEQVKERNPQTVLEIGTANGFSTIWIGDAMEQGSIVTLERSAPSFKESIENFEQAGVGEMISSLYGDAKLILEDWGKGLRQIQKLDEVPKGPQYLDCNGLVYSPLTTYHLPLTFDLVFLDAQKIHYGTFWELVQPLLTSESRVIVDDVLKFSEKTESFMSMIKSQSEWNYEVFQTDQDDGVMVLKRF